MRTGDNAKIADGSTIDERQNSAQGRTGALHSPNQSPQLFFMSRPVIIEFGAMRDRYSVKYLYIFSLVRFKNYKR